MKRLFTLSLVAAGIMLISNFAHAQVKIGYVSIEELVISMPETKTVQAQLDTLRNSFSSQLNQLYKEYTTKEREYKAGQTTMSDAVRATKETELSILQKKIQSIQQTATQEITAKTTELLMPSFKKVNEAVAAVAEELGYAYVYETKKKEFIIVPKKDDLSGAVMRRLGAKR